MFARHVSMAKSALLLLICVVALTAGGCFLKVNVPDDKSSNAVEDFDSGVLDSQYWNVMDTTGKVEFRDDGDGGYQLYLESAGDGTLTTAYWMPTGEPMSAASGFILEFDFTQPADGVGDLSFYVDFDNGSSYGNTWTMGFGSEPGHYGEWMVYSFNELGEWGRVWVDTRFDDTYSLDTKYNVQIHNREADMKITIRTSDKTTVLVESDWIKHGGEGEGGFGFVANAGEKMRNALIDNLIYTPVTL